MTSLEAGVQRWTEAEIANEASTRWHSVGEESEVLPWAALAENLGISGASGASIFSAVWVPRLKVLECVLPAQPDLEKAIADLRALTERGVEVNAILPLPALGAAHEALRGLQVHLQGWWATESALKFTPAEIA